MQLLGFSTLLVLLLGAQSQPRHGELVNPTPGEDGTRKPSKRTLQNFRTLGHFAPANIGTEKQLENKIPRTRFSQPTSQAKPQGSGVSVNQRSSSLVGRMVSQNPSQYFPAPRQHREEAFSIPKKIFGYSPNILNTPTERISRLRPRAPQSYSSGLEKELERLKMNPGPAIIRDQGSVAENPPSISSPQLENEETKILPVDLKDPTEPGAETKLKTAEILEATTEASAYTPDDETVETTTTAKTENPRTENLSTVEEPVLLAVSDKRTYAGGHIHDTPEGDGLFLIGVIGITAGCVLLVLGVGYWIRSPNCIPPGTPFSQDNSPTFHSSKLAFRSPTEEPMDSEPIRKPYRGYSREEKSRADSYKPNSRLQSEYTYQRPTSLDTSTNRRLNRMESLIDIDGDEEDDDTIYECPGLAPPGEMEVTNPFFMAGGFQEFQDDFPPCPVNINNNMKHGNINSILSH